MARPWHIIDRVSTADGVLELRQRGEHDFLITVGGLVLMNSSAHRSEVALGRIACNTLHQKSEPRVLVAGLGMGYTLRAVLDELPETAIVTVAELNPHVVTWCQGPLAHLTGSAVSDPRVCLEIADVADLIKRGAETGRAESYDAIILDLYTGPDSGSHQQNHPLYGSRAIERTRAALATGGIFAVWGENRDEGFIQRLESAGFRVSSERPGRGGLRHVVYLARLPVTH
jgi:spermidine synthase